jgi:hypothetical protein
MSHSKRLPLRRAAKTSKRQDIWNRTTRALRSITDGLGKRVDPGIKEVVIALRVYQFPTTGSCEGHLRWGVPFPWVEVGAPHPDAWKQGKRKIKAQRRKNLTHQVRLLDLLGQFYEDRTTPYDALLSLDRHGFDSFRLQSAGGPSSAVLVPAKRKTRLARYQKEMSDFAAFLKSKWLSGGFPLKRKTK